jgi:hypothetical protein
MLYSTYLDNQDDEHTTRMDTWEDQDSYQLEDDEPADNNPQNLDRDNEHDDNDVRILFILCYILLT